MFLKIFLTVLILYSTLLFPQGVFLREGSGGFLFGIRYAKDNPNSLFRTNLGYSFNGRFEAGLDIGKSVLKEQLLGYDLNLIGVAPSLGIVQHTPPFLFSLKASYIYSSMNSDGLDILGLKARSNYYSFGGTARWRYPLSANTFFQPFAGVDYIAGSESFVLAVADKPLSLYRQIAAGETGNVWTNNWAVAFGIDFCITTSSADVFYLTPNFQFNDSDNYAGIRAGFVLRTNKSTLTGEVQEIYNTTEDHGVLYCDIRAVSEHFILILMPEKINMKIGDIFYIVRPDGTQGENSADKRIGLATVVKIKENRVVMKTKLFDPANPVSQNDKLECRY